MSRLVQSAKTYYLPLFPTPKIATTLITIDEGFTSERGVQTVIDAITGPEDALFYAGPCVGGCKWNVFNMARWGTIKPNILRHQREDWKLWESFKRVALHAISVGAKVFLELPRGCTYWKDRRFRSFFTKHGFTFAVLDGYMYGLKADSGSVAGRPIKKPWKIACQNSSLPSMLNRICDGSFHSR